MKQAMALAAVLTLFAGCKKGDKKQSGTTDAPPPVGKPAAPVDAAVPRARGPEIHVVLESNPTGATVAMDHRKLGPTPLTETTVGDGREHEFVFTKDGFEPTTVKMMLMRDGVVTGLLHPAPLDGGH